MMIMTMTAPVGPQNKDDCKCRSGAIDFER